MALAGRLLVLLAVVLFAVSIAEHKASASRTEEQRQDNEHQGGHGSLKIYECKPKCDYRCSDTKYRKPCLFFCNKCCRTCLCVPSGFYGNREECACYNDWKTKEGEHKCP
ncbi:protein RSI-1-like [Lolium rigidum]|uniref:protein RSI-1-like n=1 Tax=Lolium rigidum TaxID=89674 RepID=UPI001F5D98E1|nr:protein RSI-1-like [Lolium rigidum]